MQNSFQTKKAPAYGAHLGNLWSINTSYSLPLPSGWELTPSWLLLTFDLRPWSSSSFNPWWKIQVKRPFPARLDPYPTGVLTGLIVQKMQKMHFIWGLNMLNFEALNQGSGWLVDIYIQPTLVHRFFCDCIGISPVWVQPRVLFIVVRTQKFRSNSLAAQPVNFDSVPMSIPKFCCVNLAESIQLLQTSKAMDLGWIEDWLEQEWQ